MAEWIPPKIDYWNTPRPVGGEDFKRIEGNAEYLKEQTNYLKERADKLQNEVVKRAQIITGQYTGNGRSSREILLGFTPKVVIISDYYNRVWIAVTGHGLAGVSIITNGFRVTYYASQSQYSNIDGRNYNYIAFM